MSGAPWHGTLGGYTNHGCRQECCRAAMAAYVRARRRAFRDGEVPIPPWASHGQACTYTNYACRCPACTRAHSGAIAAWRVARNGAMP